MCQTSYSHKENRKRTNVFVAWEDHRKILRRQKVENYQAGGLIRVDLPIEKNLIRNLRGRACIVLRTGPHLDQI